MDVWNDVGWRRRHGINSRMTKQRSKALRREAKCKTNVADVREQGRETEKCKYGGKDR